MPVDLSACEIRGVPHQAIPLRVATCPRGHAQMTAATDDPGCCLLCEGERPELTVQECDLCARPFLSLSDWDARCTFNPWGVPVHDECCTQEHNR